MCAIACTLDNSGFINDKYERCTASRHVADRPVVAGKLVVHMQFHPLGHNSTGERKTVRVQPAALDANQYVAILDALSAENRRLRPHNRR
jgi:hypothetical protein